MKGRIDTERARAIGRLLFQKYDLGKRGALGPKQCYEIFSDFCYRILAINPQPTMEEANSMYEILDQNKDKRVTESDFENLAVRYLCQSGQPSTGFSNNFYASSVSQGSQISQQGNSQMGSTQQVGSNKSISMQSGGLLSNNAIRYTDSRSQLPVLPTPVQGEKKLSVVARKRIDVARRLFKMFDKDNNGYLTEDEIPFILQETYKEMGQNFQPSRQDIKSYMKMVDSDADGRISLSEFEQIILKSLKNAGFQIYQV